MPLADFHRSDPFTLGIELELQVVNPPGYDLSQDASTLIADVQHQLTVGEAKHDITESMLEIATGVCRDISHAQTQLSAIQQAVQRAALRHHLQICGGGSHPFHAWQRQQISDNPRYVKTVEHFGYLAQQATVFGQHVHVGCQSGDDALYLLHGLSRFVPHFIALNAASPWFDSTDSRFACSRLNRFSSYPDNGPMPWVADWQGFRRLFRQLSYTSMIDSMKDLHWDIRPSPQFGTVEVRVMDTPLTLAQAIHIAGFIQTLACWLLTERPFKHQPDDYLLYPFNRYQACRYGLDGTLTDVRSGEQRSIRQELLQLADRLAPFAHQLKATAALEAVVRQAKSPHSEAQQMRDFIANGGSLSGLVQNTVRFGRHKAARRVYSAQTIERTAHVITLPAPPGAAAPGRRRQRRLYPHRPDADPAELSGGCAERAHCDVLAGSARQSVGFPAFAAGGYRWRRPGADGDERRHLR